MITRMRLEADGISARDCERQINFVISTILDRESSSVGDWEITDDVSWKDGVIYRSRVVMKRKEQHANQVVQQGIEESTRGDAEALRQEEGNVGLLRQSE